MGTLEETDTQGKYNDYLERLLPLIIDLGFSSQTAGAPDIVETNKI